ncbi:DUF5711 family protein [Proteocatella sphenisci]|uniref:DUF5711 family protein n=1 Tax=Proteocatella sphenisci TaxID=181070 RepID=UPI0004914291|nr:DUF5711 family protein [Proteocatella sphenisci]
MDKDRIDIALQEFLKDQELQDQREKKRQELELKKARRQKTLNKVKITAIVMLIVAALVFNPYNVRKLKDYRQQQRPREEYLITYNYSQGMQVMPFADNILIYDSSNLRLLKPSGEEIFNVNLVLDSWALEVSGKNIYLMDKVEKTLYFISSKGEFNNNVRLSNIPQKIVSGANGAIAVYYTTDVGVEGTVFFDSEGKQIADLNFPKISITAVEVNEKNQFTVHGIYRLATTLTNNVYHYSSQGQLIYSSEIKDAIVMDQIDMKDRYMLVDINNLIMLKNNTNEELFRISTTVPFISVQLHEDLIYAVDKRNKLTVIDLDGKIVDEKYYQGDFTGITWLDDEMIFYSKDYVKNADTQLKFAKPIEKIIHVGNHIGIVMKGEIKLINRIMQ